MLVLIFNLVSCLLDCEFQDFLILMKVIIISSVGAREWELRASTTNKYVQTQLCSMSGSA
jgi:hypothetical protein